jgi:hypothetical protein
MPAVVNRHHFKYVEGVGPPPKRKPRKGQNFLPDPWIYVGRGSPLGNPYRPSSASHGQEALDHQGALQLYRRWLFEKIRAGDWRVMLAFRSITEPTSVVCSCHPKPCHADIVVSAWNWMRNNRMI